MSKHLGKLLAGGFLLFVLAVTQLVAASETIRDNLDQEKKHPEKHILNFLELDKTVYQPQEKVYMNVVALFGLDNTPLPQKYTTSLYVYGPRGNLLCSLRDKLKNSAIDFVLQLSEKLPRGYYTAVAITAGSPPAIRRFYVKSDNPDVYDFEILTDKSDYAPGDKVQAKIFFYINRQLDSTQPQEKKTTLDFSVRFDNRSVYHKENIELEKGGSHELSFTIPKEFKGNRGELAIKVKGAKQSLDYAYDITVLQNTPKTEEIFFCPEGGSLVENQDTLVYAYAASPNNQGQPFHGSIYGVSKNGRRKITEIQSFHGEPVSFELVPARNENYVFLKTGSKKEYPLPKVQSQKDGWVLHMEKPIYFMHEPITFDLTAPEGFTAVLSKRDIEIAHIKGDKESKPQHLRFSSPPVAGIFSLRIFDRKDRLAARRLIFVRPTNSARITVVPEYKYYLPGEMVNVTVQNADSIKTVHLSATRENVFSGETLSLQQTVLLEHELCYTGKTCSNPFSTNDGLKIDRLLGIQEWRMGTLGEKERNMQPQSIAHPARFAAALSTTVYSPQAIPQQTAKSSHPMHDYYDFFLQQLKDSNKSSDKIKQTFSGNRDYKENALRILQDGGMPASVTSNSHVNSPNLQHVSSAPKGTTSLHKTPDTPPSIGLLRQFSFQYNYNMQNPATGSQQKKQFADTLFWGPVSPESKSMRSTVRFFTPDNLGRYRIRAQGVSTSGEVCSVTDFIRICEPLQLEADAPKVVVEGDRFCIKLQVINAAITDITLLTPEISNDEKVEYLKPQAQPFALPHKSARHFTLSFLAIETGKTNIVIRAIDGEKKTSLIIPLTIAPRQYLITEYQGGMIPGNATREEQIDIPKIDSKNQHQIKAVVIFNFQSLLKKSFSNMLKWPHGCFEQTSSTNYPLTMYAKILKDDPISSSPIGAESTAILKAGYRRLLGFECPDGGFSYFGNPPALPYLSAYGLMQFKDMSEVIPVDPKMIERTTEWLTRKTSSMRFKKNNNSNMIFSAYSLWAMLEAGVPAADINNSLQYIITHEVKEPDLLYSALKANIMLLSKNADKAGKELQPLIKTILEDKQKSFNQMFFSGGETAALTLLAASRMAGSVNIDALAHTVASQMLGKYSNLPNMRAISLKALDSYCSKSHVASSDVPFQCNITLNQLEPREIVRSPQQVQSSTIETTFKTLQKGKNLIAILNETTYPMFYQIQHQYFSPTPPPNQYRGQSLTITPDKDNVKKGETVLLQCKISPAKQTIFMPTAVIGIPAGLEIDQEQLRGMKDAGIVEYFVINQDTVELYWQSLSKPLEFILTCKAVLPGVYKGQNSRVSAYYQPDNTLWSDGVAVTVAP